MKKCQGITLNGCECNRKVTGDYCFQHANKFFSPRPEECPVCYESISEQKRPLECGHWIHKQCIVESAKAECPICRCKLQMGKRDLNKIEKLAKKRKTEDLEEEEEELRNNLSNQITYLIAPALIERINQIVGNLLNENDDINHLDVLADIFQDDVFFHEYLDFDSE